VFWLRFGLSSITRSFSFAVRAVGLDLGKEKIRDGIIESLCLNLMLK
jgi:hypothetical protein